MNVKLAVQVLGQSTSKGLNFLKELSEKDFIESDATAEFCLIMNDAFDMLNVKSKFSNIGFRQPINETNFEKLYEKAQAIIKYILTLKDTEGLQVITVKKKTGFIGLIINLTNIFLLFKQINKHMSYLLSFKVSQDFLETFFVAIRIRGGYNNNPNVLQFKSAYKRLLMNNDV